MNVNGQAVAERKLAALIEAANAALAAMYAARDEFFEQGQGFASKYMREAARKFADAIAEARK